MTGAAGARQIFLAATGQNRGKTTTSLGLFAAFRAQGLDAGFMKPVGQRWITIDDTPADEDAALMRARQAGAEVAAAQVTVLLEKNDDALLVATLDRVRERRVALAAPALTTAASAAPVGAADGIGEFAGLIRTIPIRAPFGDVAMQVE